MTDKPENQLVVAVKETGLKPNKVESLLENFADDFNKAKKLVNASKDIVVTDESQVDKMAKAREARLELKNVRIDVEKTRKELKEESLREGKAIDGASNLIKALIIPVEKHLEKQEKYAEVKELERIEKRHSERISKLLKYVEDVNPYNLKDMSDGAFDKLLKTSKAAHEAEVAAEKKAEDERLDQEKKAEENRIKIENENKRLKKEAEEREKKVSAEKKADEIKLKEEQEKRGKAEAKLKAEKKAQEEKKRAVREADEAFKKVKEEEKRKALLAPDKVKLNNLANDIDNFKLPHVESKEAGEAINEAVEKLEEASNLLREKAKAL